MWPADSNICYYHPYKQEKRPQDEDGRHDIRDIESRGYLFLTGFPFPLGPTLERETVMREIDPGSVWVLEQTQALEAVGVYTPVRMTVIKLASGGLWIHGPLAPTGQCISLLRSIGCPVEFIILPTFAYEHKAFLAPFARRFPGAQVYVSPCQWSYPINLPNRLLGIDAELLGATEEGMPWSGDIEQRLLLPPSISFGEFARQGECAFFHKGSRTLIVTDSLAYLDDRVPEVTISVPADFQEGRKYSAFMPDAPPTHTHFFRTQPLGHGSDLLAGIPGRNHHLCTALSAVPPLLHLRLRWRASAQVCS